LEPGQAGFFAVIEEPETLIPGTEFFSFLPDLVREKMGMGIDDHRVGSNSPGSDGSILLSSDLRPRRRVEEFRGIW
jgi:hypothetical protein